MVRAAYGRPSGNTRLGGSANAPCDEQSVQVPQPDLSKTIVSGLPDHRAQVQHAIGNVIARASDDEEPSR